MKGRCRSFPAAAMPLARPIVHNASTDAATRSKTTFATLRIRRRIATRYDKLARNFLAATALVGALYWIRLWFNNRTRTHIIC